MTARERSLLVWNGRVARVKARARSLESPGRRQRAQPPEHDENASDELARLGAPDVSSRTAASGFRMSMSSSDAARGQNRP
jgi:hypothetical protein